MLFFPTKNFYKINFLFVFSFFYFKSLQKLRAKKLSRSWNPTNFKSIIIIKEYAELILQVQTRSQELRVTFGGRLT